MGLDELNNNSNAHNASTSEKPHDIVRRISCSVIGNPILPYCGYTLSIAGIHIIIVEKVWVPHWRLIVLLSWQQIYHFSCRMRLVPY